MNKDMILKDLLELMDDDEEITVIFNGERDEKGNLPSVSGPVWTMPWRVINKEIQRISVFNNRVQIFVENREKGSK